jgi:hypothetical protein
MEFGMEGRGGADIAADRGAWNQILSRGVYPFGSGSGVPLVIWSMRRNPPSLKIGDEHMRKLLIALFAAASVCSVGPEEDAVAAPMNAAAIAAAFDAASMVQDARVYCALNGRFWHWGRCHRHRRVIRRVYCYNRRTGRFLHWGHC